MNTAARTDTDSIISTHPYRSGPLGHDGQPRCSDCLAKSDHPAHEAFANAGPFATEERRAEARAIAERPHRMTVRWTEEGDRWVAEDGTRRLEVFSAPLKPGKWCWRRLRMNIYWRLQDGGIADTIEAAMDAAGTSLAGGPKAWASSTRSVAVR